mgnify:CR=1 FL=1
MSITADYLGMPLSIDELDGENLAYFKHCAAHEFHLQLCESCNLLRYPPTTACPWCMRADAKWVPVEGKGPCTPTRKCITPFSLPSRARTPYLVSAGRSRHAEGQAKRARGLAGRW